MSIVADVAVTILLLLGSGFALIGSWGLVRLRSTMERLHGPTKATTLGLGALLVASVVFFQAKQNIWTAHELLISLFLFITAPISACLAGSLRRKGVLPLPQVDMQLAIRPGGKAPPFARGCTEPWGRAGIIERAPVSNVEAICTYA